MALKLTIGNTLEFPVKGSLRDGARTVTFSFTLTGDRLSADVQSAELGQESDLTVREFLERHINGWSGQRLVADDDGQPADFSPEAFGLLLGISTMGGTILRAYVDALAISETSAGRAKN